MRPFASPSIGTCGTFFADHSCRRAFLLGSVTLLLGLLAFSATPYPSLQAATASRQLGQSANLPTLNGEASLFPYQDPVDGAAGVAAGIARVTGSSAGGPVEAILGTFQARLIYDPSCVNILGFRAPNFTVTQSSINNAAGAATFRGTAAAGVAVPADLGYALTRLVARATRSCTLTLQVDQLTDFFGAPIAVPATAGLTLMRGDARADEEVTIADALFIAQQLVGLREACSTPDVADCLHPVNGASVRPDNGSDSNTIADALLIAQYLVGIRNDLYIDPGVDSTAPPAPALLLPTDAGTTTDATPSFQWSAVTDPSGVSYLLQVDRDLSFAPPLVLDEAAFTNRFTVAENQSLGPGEYFWRVRAVDGAGNSGGFSPVRTFTVVAGSPIVSVVRTSPADGESGVSVTRETVVEFSGQVDPATVTQASVKALFGGQDLAARRHLSPSGTTVTLFFDDPLPASARVRLVINGDLLTDKAGVGVDADGDGLPGGALAMDFSTLSLTRIAGTEVWGLVFDSYSPQKPVEGATIRVDGFPEANAVTDATGKFTLRDMPAPVFFVHIDGSTATNAPPGSVYATVGKPFHSVSGRSTQLSMDGQTFNVYLPPMSLGDIQTLSPMQETAVVFGAAGRAELVRMFPQVDPQVWDRTVVLFPPNSAVDDAGAPATQAAIIPVPADRLPAPLPPNVNHLLDIAVMASGATNFTDPAPACFPNLPVAETGQPLLPGEKSALWSFNHDTGRWEVVGPMTTSSDGQLVCTDPGVGIRAPGWHGTNPGVTGGGGDIFAGGGPEGDEEPPTSCTVGADKVADPVYLFSGEFYLDVEDLRITGRGLDFVWERKYRSKIGPNTAMGNGWDFSYNISIQQQGLDILLRDGNTRSDTYRRQPDGSWSRREYFRELVRNLDGSYTLIFEDRRKWEFNPLGGSPASGKLSTILDRNGNGLSFSYDGAGRLVTVTDTLNRQINIGYNANGNVSAITDFAGRAVRYEYYDGIQPGGNLGDLKAVRTPAITGTPNANDFPNGKTTTYTYSSGFLDPRLNHNLLTVTDGRRNDPDDPTFGIGPYLTNIYSATTNPADLNFDRVVKQVWGNPTDTVHLVYVPQLPSRANGQTVTKTIVTDRVGNVKEFFYDTRNRLVRSREFTGRSQANLPATEISNRPAGRLRSTDPLYFETRYEWNDDSLQKRVIHPNGNVTEYVYESDLNPVAPPHSRANLRVLRHRPGSHTPPGDQEVIEESYEYADNFGSGCCGANFVTRRVDARGNETRHSYDARGNLVRTIYRLPSIIDDFEYNQFGQLTAHTHPDNGSGHRRRDTFTYYEVGPQRGYLHEDTGDATGFALTTAYEYDLVGNIVRKTDPRGHDTRYVVNALDQVVQEISREVRDGSGTRYQKATFYDANNNVVRMDVENIDDQGVLQSNSQFTTRMEYDILDQMMRTIQEVDQGKTIITEHEYDANRNRTLTRSGEATNGNQPTNVVGVQYDERDLVFRMTRAPGGPDQATTQHDYDGNGNRVRTSVGIESTPRVRNLVYDGYNRNVSETDPMGNVTLFNYDPNHNRVRERIMGELVDVPGSAGNVLLAETTSDYDPMNRQVRVEDAFFDLATQNPLGDGRSVRQLFYSDYGQILRLVDDNGHQVRTSYDTANRRGVVTDHKGNTVTSTYDGNSNLITTTAVDKSDLGRPDATFVTTFAYDNLDRLIRLKDNLNNIIEYGYDSRNNRTLKVDALRPDPNGPGNQTVYRYDGLSRLIETTRFLTDSGAGGGTPAGAIVTTQSWDDSSRLVQQADDSGNTTSYTYDALNRRVATRFADGTTSSTVYDVHDNPTSATDANGSAITFQYDLLNRLAHKAIVPGPGVSTQTTFESYQHNGLSQPVRVEDNDALVSFSYDSLGHITSESRNGRTTARVYDAVGNQLRTTYPGGYVLTTAYDELDRKQAITDGSRTIAAYKYVGPSLVERREFANNTRTSYEYDGVKRVTRTTHTFDPAGTPTVVDDRAYTWDPMNNKTSRHDLLPDGLTHTYTYDSTYRMIRSVKEAPGVLPQTISYNFDGVGNRTTVAGGAAPGPYTMDGTLPEPGDAPVNQYTTTALDRRGYDKNGNLTSMESGAATLRQLTYDYRNQMVAHVNTETGVTTTYAYDPLGRRIEKVVSGDAPQTTGYFYDGWQVIEEQDAAGATQALYVYGRSLEELLTMRRDGQDFYYQTDDLHNVMKVTDSAGATVEGYEYGDYGHPTFLDALRDPISRSAIGNPYLFNSQRYDPETGFYYYRTRYLDPLAGRFTTRDTIGIWGDPVDAGNGFTYLGNNPWSTTDPMGMGPKSSGMSRFFGALKLVGGLIETAGGIALGAATSWTGVGAVGGVVIAAHGIDGVIAGARQLWSGEHTESFTHQGVEKLTGSSKAATVVDLGISVVGPGAFSKLATVGGPKALVHLTDEAGYAGITASQTLAGGNVRAFALDMGVAPRAVGESGLARVAATMAPKAGPGLRIPIPEAAASRFVRPPAFGPFAALRRNLGQVSATSPGAINLRTGEFVPGMMWDRALGAMRPMTARELGREQLHQHLLDYGVDALGVGTAAYASYSDHQHDQDYDESRVCKSR